MDGVSKVECVDSSHFDVGSGCRCGRRAPSVVEHQSSCALRGLSCRGASLIGVQVISLRGSVTATLILMPSVRRRCGVLRVGQELVAFPRHVLLRERNHPVGSMGNKVDDVADVASRSIDEYLVPMIFVLNLHDMCQVGVVVVGDNVFLLSRPIVVLAAERSLGRSNGVGSGKLRCGGADGLCESNRSKD